MLHRRPPPPPLWRRMLFRGVPIALAGSFVLFLVAIALLIERDLPGPEVEARYATSQSRFLTLNGNRIHVQDEGPPGRPVLFLIHGSNGSLFTYDPWVERLKDRFRLVRLDLPGYGLTGPAVDGDYSTAAYTDVVERVRAALDIQAMTVVGHSMGGAVAWHYALAYPDRTERLVLVAAAGLPRDGPPPAIFRLARLPGIGSLMRWVTPRAVVEANLRQVWADQGRVSPEMVDQYHALLLRAGNRRATLDRMTRPPEDAAAAAQRLGEIKVPVLILWGALDPWIPADQAREFATRMPQAITRIYPQTGHLPQEEQADRSAADVSLFVENRLRP